MKNIVIASPRDLVPILTSYTRKRVEHFIVVCLDSGRRLISKKVISIGSENRALISEKSIFWEAFGKKASAIIIVHNHPSCNVEPSVEDIEMTKTLEKACDIVGLPLLDHIIIGKYSYFSFVEHDLLLNKKICENKVAEEK